ncbi:hypothetical protein E8E13_004919 [Curvularia kusanoi]|uniref:Uncharacterized protein n=1 Tax=Curvularia kusanoi TaxID=90978 RepID=A0A9P4W8H7_CURKU|nr:hypothetical protein E8E13_004919 [Curvularia kusanoi]
MALLQTCQILYTEAASWFCANNFFMMQQAAWVPRTGIATVDVGLQVCGGIVVDLQELLARLSPHTGIVCKISMNLKDEGRSIKFIQVTECLRTIWQSGVSDNLQFKFVTYADMTFEQLEAFNRAFRSLQIGAMNVKKYHRAVENIYIKRDGSGGAIAWGPYGGPHARYDPPYDADFSFDDCNVVKFSTTESGIAWESKLPHRAIELMKLPMKIRNQIFRMATLQTYEVDLDSGKRVTHGILCNDEDSLNELRRQYVVDDRTIITMSTTSSKSTFSNFDKLRKIVREDQEVMLYRNKDIPEVQFNLHFKLQDEATLDDLRISILPFIMETSEAPGWFRVEISVFHDRSGEMTPGPTHSITLSTLRSATVKALSTAIAGFKAGRGISHIWINGRGKVIDSYIVNAVDPFQYLIEKSNLATEVWEDSREGPYRIKKLHTIDADYRGLRSGL